MQDVGPVPAGVAGTVDVIVPGDEKTTALSLAVGDRVEVQIFCPADRLEPFHSQPDSPPPLQRGEPRAIFVCMEHPDVQSATSGVCPRDERPLMPRPVRGDQRVRWWCPMHPEVTADQPGAACQACGGMPLVARVVSYRRPGTVLSVPASAVIEDGVRKVAYVERAPGMFDGVVLELGPRCGSEYPVVSGLQPGDRVAAQGAFLIDAESRLNPALAAGYFGAGHRGTSTPLPSADATATASIDQLPEPDRAAALRQARCPVTDKPLGSMGVPVKVVVKGRTVFACCSGCVPAIEGDPSKYLAKLPPSAGEAVR